MISLGKKYDETCCVPAPEIQPGKMSYPTLYFRLDKPLKLPDGEFKFSGVGRVVKDSKEARNPDDPEYCYEIEIQGIEADGMKEEKEDEADVKGGIKVAMKNMMKKKMGEDY